MEKVITINEKEIRFKSSAATNILYKRTFKNDVLVKITAYTKNLKELKNIQARITELKNDESKSKEEIASEMTTLVQSDVMNELTAFSSDILPRLAYIMYLEANEEQRTIFSKLNEEAYLGWLMEMDQDDLTSITGEIMTIWLAGAKTTSKPKN
jgi:hypothetical protein